MVQKYLQKTSDELKIRNYSQKTIKSYIFCLKDFFYYLKTNFENPQIVKIKQFLLNKQNQGYSAQTINLYLNSIKFFYREVIKNGQPIHLKFAKTNKKLPIVLSRAEIEKIIHSIKNPKHKLMVCLSYGAGLRISEVISLKTQDINLENLTIHLKNAKGKKGRLTIFPEKIKAEIQNLIAGKNKSDLVFASEQGGALSERTAQKIFKRALKQAKIKKPATFHSLRHSFAAHLLENGVDIRHVQELLGHQNIRTTQQYTKVTNPAIKNIKSPF